MLEEIFKSTFIYKSTASYISQHSTAPSPPTTPHNIISSHGVDGLFNDGGGFNQLLLGDDERRGNPDHLPTDGLGQNAIVPQLEADVPSIDV